jgi:hypothetical protein
MKTRLRRIWDDISKRLSRIIPEKLKCRRKSSSSNVIKISVEEKQKVDEKEGKVNKAYQDNQVHPFQITQ